MHIHYANSKNYIRAAQPCFIKTDRVVMSELCQNSDSAKMFCLFLNVRIILTTPAKLCSVSAHLVTDLTSKKCQRMRWKTFETQWHWGSSVCAAVHIHSFTMLPRTGSNCKPAFIMQVTGQTIWACNTSKGVAGIDILYHKPNDELFPWWFCFQGVCVWVGLPLDLEM